MTDWLTLVAIPSASHAGRGGRALGVDWANIPPTVETTAARPSIFNRFFTEGERKWPDLRGKVGSYPNMYISLADRLTLSVFLFFYFCFTRLLDSDHRNYDWRKLLAHFCFVSRNWAYSEKDILHSLFAQLGTGHGLWKLSLYFPNCIYIFSITINCKCFPVATWRECQSGLPWASSSSDPVRVAAKQGTAETHVENIKFANWARCLSPIS